MPKWKIKVTPDRDVSLSIDGIVDGESLDADSKDIDSGGAKYVARSSGDKLFVEFAHAKQGGVQFDIQAWRGRKKMLDITRTIGAGEWLFFDCRPKTAARRDEAGIEVGVIDR